jgi:hypothetical protein
MRLRLPDFEACRMKTAGAIGTHRLRFVGRRLTLELSRPSRDALKFDKVKFSITCVFVADIDVAMAASCQGSQIRRRSAAGGAGSRIALAPDERRSLSS